MEDNNNNTNNNINNTEEHKPYANDIIAGRNPVMEVLNSKLQISRILVAKGNREGSIKGIIAVARKKDILVKEVAPMKLDSLIPQKNHQGIIAFISPVEYSSIEAMLSAAKEKEEDPFIVILDGIEDVHNFGAIARTAEACGAHGIVIQKHRAAPITPIAVKASAGALLHIPVAVVTNITRTIETLQKEGIWTVGTSQDSKTNYYESDITGPVAVIIGSEGKGISRLVSTKCDFMLSIPMKGKINSLNASAAAAVILYEVLKQRSK